MHLTKLPSSRTPGHLQHCLKSLQPAAAARRRSVACAAGIHARWSLDARYGFKADATALLAEWVRDIGAAAGLNAANTRLSTGAIGMPESRLELEVTFDSITAWEDFLARIPPAQHKAWSQRIQAMVVDGSPTWQVLRSMPLELQGPPSPALSAAVAPSQGLYTGGLQQPGTRGEAPGQLGLPSSSSSSSGGGSSSSLFIPDLSQGFDLDKLQSLAGSPGVQQPPTPQRQVSPPPPLPSTQLQPQAPSPSSLGDDVEVVLDWKGEPMTIKKGDKMPKFL